MPKFSILAICLASFFQLMLGVFTLKWDNLSIGYIYSNYISQCVEAGIFPYWNPYLYLGAPVFSNLAARFHFIWLWIFSYSFGYSIWALHIEFLMTYLLSGIGMYQFLSIWYHDRKLKLIGSISFMLSGAMIAHAQHLSIVFSMMCFPWLLYGIYRVIIDSRRKHILLIGIMANWALTGGYPGINFIIFYICILYIIYLFYQKRSLKGIYAIVGGGTLFFVLSIPYLYSLYIHMDQIGRTDPISLEKALGNPLSPICFFSFFQPGFIISESSLFNTDLSMRNVYLGVLSIPLCIYSLFYIRQSRVWVIILMTVIFASFSVGGSFYTRELLYHHIPLMNYSKFSSLFRFFMLFGIILIMMESLNHICQNASWNRLTKILKIYPWIYLGAMGLCFIYLTPDTPNLHRFIEISVILFLVQTIIYLGMRKGLAILSTTSKKMTLILFVISLDFLAVTQIMSPVLVYDRKKSLYDFQAEYKKHNRGFDFIANKRLGDYTAQNWAVFEGKIDNNTVWLKEPTVEGYNPSKPNNFHRIMERSHPRERPILFSNDTGSGIILKYIGPNSIIAEVLTKNQSMISISQSYFEGWKVYVDSMATPLIVKDYMPSVQLKAGRHIVEFRYELREILYLHYFQMVLSALILIVYLGSAEKLRSASNTSHQAEAV